MIADDSIRVFHANESDIDALTVLLEGAHYESPVLSVTPFSVERAIDTILTILSRNAGDALALIAYQNGQPVGCMGAMLCPQLTSDDLLATELILYVIPKMRGSRTAYMLVRIFEKWAAPYDMRAGSSLGIDDQKAVNFYRRLGYELASMGVMKRGSSNG